MGYVKGKQPKFSYSKLNVYDVCHFKYYLMYTLGHHVSTDLLASKFGTLLHFIEESIAKSLKKGEPVDYDKLKREFTSINIPKKDKFDTDGGIYGIDILKEKYKEEFYETNEEGKSYYTKSLDYLSGGIYRLEEYLKANPDLQVYDMEKFFSFDFEGYILYGFIDRIFYDKKRDVYLIEDIKTKGKPFKEDDLTTPFQFVIYALALIDVLGLSEDRIECAYDLPIVGIKQKAGTKGFIPRGRLKLKSIFSGISSEDYRPHPTPLCHWCQYCHTNEEAPAEGKDLCPYYSKWTRENKTREVQNQWKDLSSHEKIMQRFANQLKAEGISVESKDLDGFEF